MNAHGRTRQLCFQIAIVFAVTLAASEGGASSLAVLQQYLQTASGFEDDAFLRDFPYDAYLEERDIANFRLLEEDRSILQKNGRNGDRVLLNLYSRYLLRHPIDPTDPNDVQRLLDLSDGAIAYSAGEGRRLAIYQTVGYLLLDDLVAKVERAIANKQLLKNRRASQHIVQSLARRGYIVSFPTSRLDKLIQHVKANNWRYIADRLWKDIVLRGHPALFGALAVLAGLTFASWSFMRRPGRRARNAEVLARRSSSTTALLTLLLAVTGLVSTASAQALSELPDRQYYNSEMSIRRLYYGSEQIGSIIWLKRGSEKIKAKYFASGQVFQKYSTFNETVILACAGAFTERYGDILLPQGLTVDNGMIINRTRNLAFDGLVIVYPTGGIAVSDIEKEYLYVEENGSKQKLDILKSEDKTSFLDWAQRNKATVFQTQLLASTAGLRLDVTKAQTELRERRFLGIVRDNRTKEVMHVIVNVSKPFYLGPLTKLVYEHLQRQTSVIGLLNLDTGDYNIFQVNAPNGDNLSYLTGPRPINIATNLLVYYYTRN